MGKFDGYLICSDMDNTLTFEGEVVKENLDAIRYFQSNGGYFTVCSGRNPEHFRKFTEFFEANTYVIGFGGAKAVDLRSGDVLFQAVYTDRMKEIYAEIVEECEVAVRSVFFHFTGDPTFTTFSLADFKANKGEILARSISKAGVRFLPDSDDAAYTRHLKEKYRNDTVEIVRSYIGCLELISENGSKRTASHKLKEALGAHTLICVGDFENDISMISAADIGYAVGNACDDLKAVADRITVPASEGAIKAIIEDIEKNLK